MNKSERISNFYNKLLEYRNTLRTVPKVHSLSSNNYPIKKTINDIVNKNNDYLLTNSYLYFLAVTAISNYEYIEPYSKVLYEKLSNFSKDKESIIKEVFDYLDSYHTYRINKMCNYNYQLSYDLPVNIRKFATPLEYNLNDLYNQYMLRIEADDSLSNPEYSISKIILNIYSCLSFYDSDINVFENLAKPFLDDPKNIIDELKMNGLFLINYDDKPLYNLDDFISYFVNTPQDKNKKLIR